MKTRHLKSSNGQNISGGNYKKYWQNFRHSLNIYLNSMGYFNIFSLRRT